MKTGASRGVASMTATVNTTTSYPVTITFRQPIVVNLTGPGPHSVLLDADATNINLTVDGVAQTPVPTAQVNQATVNGAAGGANNPPATTPSGTHLPRRARGARRRVHRRWGRRRSIPP